MALSAGDQALFEAAEAIRPRAHVPYSHFHVGAAILADDGNIYAGCNVENAAYPLGNCAEASAIAAMIAGGGKRIVRIFVTGPGQAPVTPCGGCRQRIREFAELTTPVICLGVEGGMPLETTLGDLLPHSFGPSRLGARSAKVASGFAVRPRDGKTATQKLPRKGV